MKKKTVEALALVGVVLVGIWYFFIRVPAATVGSIASGILSGSSGLGVPNSTVPVDQSDGTDAPLHGSATGLSDPTATSPGVGEDATVMAWIGTLSTNDQQTMNNSFPSMPQADKDLIYDLVSQNLWGQSAETGPWNAFISKYHILGR